MDAKEATMIDFNRQVETSIELDSARIAPDSTYVSHGVSLATPFNQDLPVTGISGRDTLQVVVEHRLRTNHVGAAAEFIGEAGTPLDNGSFIHCSCCGKPETRKKTLICDACVNSYHLRCLKVKESQVSDLDEWTCVTCVAANVKSKWALGRIRVNQQTGPLVGDSKDISSTCKLEVGGISTLELNLLQNCGVIDGLGSSFADNSGVPNIDGSLGRKSSGDNTVDEPKTRVKRLKTFCRAKDDAQADVRSSGRMEALDSASAGERNSITSASGLSKELDDDMEASSKDIEAENICQEHLQKLKEFLGQYGRTLEGDWTILWKKRSHAENIVDITYVSPERQKFRSKVEVARFLGALEHRKEDASTKEAFPGRGRKPDSSQEPEPAEGRLSKRSKLEAANHAEAHLSFGDLEHQLPFQHMDLRVDSLGVIQLRAGYYDDHFIWPVGYRCLWHDGVTGSVCISEIIDGGHAHPIFRVTRKSCKSNLCDDNGFLRKNAAPMEEISGMEICQASGKAQGKPHLTMDHVYDEDHDLNMLQGALTSFVDGDVCVSLEDNSNNQWVKDSSQNGYSGCTAVEGIPLKPGSFGFDQTSEDKEDQIGEIVVEDSSPAGAWKLLAEQVVNRILKLHERGSFEMGCKHSDSSFLSVFALNNLSNMQSSTSAKANDVHIFSTKLLEWISQERFGFNIPAVQKHFEIQKAKLKFPRPSPPPGWPVCERIPSHFVGDLLQIWEFLGRFAEILGQKEPPLLEDLEEIVADSSEIESRRVGEKKAMPTHRECTSNYGTSSLFSSMSVNKDVESKFQNQESGGAKMFMKSKPIGSPCGCSAALAASNVALLKIAVSELQQLVSGCGSDAALDVKRGKKKDGEATGSVKRQPMNVMPLNELTWPEIARRYAIGLLTLNACGENLEISTEDRRKILRCVQGDGAALCGALDGVAAIEADALVISLIDSYNHSRLLATAEEQISRWLPGAEDKSTGEPPGKGDLERKFPEVAPFEGSSSKPAWAVVLEPVRKLATNVGARIRNCIREALDLNPPDWARERLEWSISKEVYKGNASGPTKRAVLAVLERVANEKHVIPAPKIEKKVEYVVPTPALVMRRCRVILRQLVTSDDVRVFCNSLGGTVLGYFENEDDNFEVPLPLVSRPLDFRIIDSRLAAGSYGGSHESYAADMRQLFQNIPYVFHNREDLLKVGRELSQQFESLYEEKVLKLVNGKEEIPGSKDVNQADTMEGTGAAIEDKTDLTTVDSAEELKKAPWEEGVCKICGVDKDDDSTLLCDGCDAEYHIYCLEPPLSMIPEGNWYCPACVAREQDVSSSLPATVSPDRTIFKPFDRSQLPEDGSVLSTLVKSMDGKDYWHLTGSQRVQLLKFLCDKVLESTCIRDHIDQSIEALPELQQKLRAVLIEQQASGAKGGCRVDESAATDSIEVVSKDTFPKKRGRKSTKSNLVSVEESSRILNGMEAFKSPADACGLGLDSTVDMVDRKVEKLTCDDSGVAHAAHVSADSQKADPLTPTPFFVSQLHSDSDSHINAIRSSQNSIQSQNGNMDMCTHSISSNNHLPNIPSNIVESHHSFVTASVGHPVEVTCSDELKGPSSVSHGLKIENQREIVEDPGAPSDTNRASEMESDALMVAEITSGKTAADSLREEIERLEGEIMRMAPRRECLGRDNIGRTYWALGWAGRTPWVLAERAPAVDSDIVSVSCKQAESVEQLGIQEWSGYSDGECMDQLLKWLRPTIATEGLLKSALIKWSSMWSSKYKKEPDKQPFVRTKHMSLNTKASTILTKMFGSISQPQGQGEEPAGKRGRKKKSIGDGKFYRCDCLELVWTARIHCPYCHHTYDTISELNGHNNGACSWRGFDDEGQALALARAKKAKIKGQDFQSLDLSFVIKRFTVHTTNRSRILQIGCLGEEGARFVSAPPISPLLDPSLYMKSEGAALISEIEKLDAKDVIQFAGNPAELVEEHAQHKLNGLTDIRVSDNVVSKEQITSIGTLGNTVHHNQTATGGTKIAEATLIATRGHSLPALLPPSQPLLYIKQDMWAFRKLKASLLDIESLLSSDMMEPSRSEPNRRRAWRSFVKSAASILEQCNLLPCLSIW
ncbi:hypothetical protein KP509_19G068300 [Ceratopteris richardii]|uniref:PHD-type domain-containing protein n=1 Tax=Ceratopteris richardii TaxID=49495 RepID=A0A8T2SPW0_CERRI|nr:hypothetical protein KP509_19G068300 [Ceratopteris richardii]